jgi:uncharacterized protein (DUF952 family)
MELVVLHVCTQAEWFASPPDFYEPANFFRDGFIHCCSEKQLAGVLDRYFKGQSDLVLLRIDIEKLRCPLIYEGGPDSEKFPHAYGRLNKDAIISVGQV